MMRVVSCVCMLVAVVGIGAPNVLFIAIDDLKPDLGCYGVGAAKTPAIDRLAARGVTFRNNQCNWPVCGPSRASLMTGLRPEYTGVTDLKTRMRDVHPDILTIPQHFRNHGYETAAVGKIYDPRCVESRKKDDPPSWSIPYVSLPYHKFKGDGDAVTAAPAVPDDQLADGVIGNLALDLLDTLASRDKPFFLAVGFKKPHLPFVAPKKYWDLYDPAALPLDGHQEKVVDGTRFSWHDSKEVRGYKGVPETPEFSPAFQRHMIHGYYACVSYVDAQIGRLLDRLEKLGLRDNTVIVLWGDHGFHLGDHGIWGKHTVLENAARSPLIIAPPTFATPVSVTAPSEFIDLFPTLCDMAGLATPDNLHGVSLAPAFDGKTVVKEAAVTMFGRGYSMRTSRYRYNEWQFNEKIQVELFDYHADPKESRNLANSPEYAPIRAALAAQLRKISGLKRFEAQ